MKHCGMFTHCCWIDRDKAKPAAVNFATVRNIDEYGCDFGLTIRAGMRCWNKSVQFWLSNYVYKRLSFFENAQVK